MVSTPPLSHTVQFELYNCTSTGKMTQRDDGPILKGKKAWGHGNADQDHTTCGDGLAKIALAGQPQRLISSLGPCPLLLGWGCEFQSLPVLNTGPGFLHTALYLSWSLCSSPTTPAIFRTETCKMRLSPQGKGECANFQNCVIALVQRHTPSSDSSKL